MDLLERLVVGSVAITERAIAAAGTNLTFVQWRVLLIVGEQPEGATVGEIAARIGARGSPASRLISRLKERGVVVAERDAADRRVSHIRLTRARPRAAKPGPRASAARSGVGGLPALSLTPRR